MLIFGPYRAIPQDDSFVIYNLTSPTQAIPRLPGLFVTPNQPIICDGNDDGMFEKSFDMWYYEYVLNDFTACTSMMAILSSLYNGDNVYVCISDTFSNGIVNMVNDSFMKMIQARYGIKYAIINEPEDYLYLNWDGCDFMTVDGIQTFDADRKQFIQITEEQRILGGGKIENGNC